LWSYKGLIQVFLKPNREIGITKVGSWDFFVCILGHWALPIGFQAEKHLSRIKMPLLQALFCQHYSGSLKCFADRISRVAKEPVRMKGRCAGLNQ
jgi:hypothetical protein